MATSVKLTTFLESQHLDVISFLVSVYQNRTAVLQSAFFTKKLQSLGFLEESSQLPVFVRTLLSKTKTDDDKTIFLNFVGYLTTSSVTEFNAYFQFLKNQNINQLVDFKHLKSQAPKKLFFKGIFSKASYLSELDPNFYFKKMEDYLEETNVLLRSVDRIGLDLRAKAVEQSFQKAQKQDQLLDEMIYTFEHFKTNFTLFFNRLLTYKTKIQDSFDRLKPLVDELESRDQKSVLMQLAENQKVVTPAIPVNLKKEKINSF